MFHIFKRRPSRFRLLMDRATRMADRGEKEGLRDLRKIVMKPIQVRHITHAYSAPDHAAIEEADWMFDLGFNLLPDPRNSRGRSYFSEYCWNRRIPEASRQKIELDLATEIVLPTPWHPGRMLGNLGRIVKSDSEKAFRQDPNHHVVWLVPLEVGWVASGNHSIAQAIIAGSGQVTPKEAYDISDLLNEVYFDGRCWKYASEDNFGTFPRYEELGWAWEITRLLSALG
ncbi:DUF6710 family protein [Halomonas elongata]|uniref:DUF6710 family protein n=1 Tax=Halomonas elongata (strain ATCC 33173 / DSM 2581 / NBRC 15536 / NCIMB 2198 / 1H9) TaxID=768066 RepID=A0A1R4A4J8_HALED|nr:DUF6710 family protein [Halomonas elongata]WBF17689.1 hypothetical protein LM502_16680 [Halomonas elongata]WPU46530.1 DUF6710 family protein [Halomonas elongata DSM 2581]SJK83868.1 uncharacterized protein HELO_4063B [Halomonas elongata DSM 2581]